MKKSLNWTKHAARGWFGRAIVRGESSGEMRGEMIPHLT